jgi:hypothetical protein
MTNSDTTNATPTWPFPRVDDYGIEIGSANWERMRSGWWSEEDATELTAELVDVR